MVFIDNRCFLTYNLTSKTHYVRDKTMNRFNTTKMSSKGQIVIPEDIRAIMGLITGDHFIIVAEKDVVILKLIKKPSLKEYAATIKKARLQAKQVGMKVEDVAHSIKTVRSKR
jgi:AbrB family looped-hinge helix DNA binding protein